MNRFFKKVVYNNIPTIIFFLIITIYLSFPFFKDINFIGHDLEFHLLRIKGISSGLNAGIFPVKIYPNYFNNYGYANGIFYPDMFLYFPAILHSLGIKLITSFKIFMFCINFATVFSIYICIYQITKSKFSALCGVILYSLSPYRLTDIYPRGALGEILSFIFIPIAILGIYEILFGNSKKWYIISIGFLGVLNSHIISFTLLCGLAVIFFIFNIKILISNKERLYNLLIAAGTSIMLSLWFLLPLLEQLLRDKFTVNTVNVGSNLTKAALPPYELLNSFKFSSYTPIFELPQNKLIIGLLLTILPIVCICFSFRNTVKCNLNKFNHWCLSLGIISLLLCTSIFPWKLVKDIFSFMQFPWRLLIFATLFLCIYVSISIRNIIKKNIPRYIFLCILLIFSLILTYPTLKAINSLPLLGGYDFSLNTNNVGTGEYIPANTNLEALLNRGEILTSNDSKLHTSNYIKNGNRIKFDFVSSSNNFYIDVPLLYYRGYEANITDENNNTYNLKVDSGENNILRIYVKKHTKGTINISYSKTPLSKVSHIVSFISLIIIICLSLYKHKQIKLKS